MVELHLNCCSQEREADMKILFFEDREEDIQGIVDYCDDHGYEYFHDKFEDGSSRIEEYDPDIIVVDLKNAQDHFEGCDILAKIWEHRFRPTCVFSGQIIESTIEQERYSSPLIEFITKGDEKPVIDFIDRISPYIECIKEVQCETYRAMRKSFDFFHLAMNDKITDTSIIAALCGNRIKTYFDNENSRNDMPIWSQYVYPIMDEQISTGDIIMLKHSTEQTAIQKKFFIVLSQSCDIAHGKIDDILVAKCYDIENFLRKRYIAEDQYEMRTPDELKIILNAGFVNEFFPLPAIDGVIPNIAVNLKALKLIPKSQLSSNYKKIASLSSPYKERLVWAYMQNACRPGVPDLAVEAWIDSLCLTSEMVKAAEEIINEARKPKVCGV